MIDIELVRDDFDTVADSLAKRGVARGDLEKLRAFDAQWRELLGHVETLRAKQNEANDAIAAAKADEKGRLIAEMQQVAADLKEKESELEENKRAREVAWRVLPNLLADDVPEGNERESVELDLSPVNPPDREVESYLVVAKDLIDIERAAKVSGSRFVYLKGQLVRLEMGLVSYALDVLTEAGFNPIIPPVLVKEEAMRGMGYLDHEGDEIYQTQDDLYLVGTSEQSIGPMHMDEILLEAELPLRYVGFSTCFRREAGSHGKDVKGMLRVHQFDKVEMFSFTTPDKSAEEHGFLLLQQRVIMDALELPYRVMKLAAGDLGSSSAKTYDIETWLPGEGQYRETSSASNTTDWQARRLNIRTRYDDGRIEIAHMLNGTAIAIGRILIALLENHQQADGSVAIPKVLHPYLPFTHIRAAEIKKPAA